MDSPLSMPLSLAAGAILLTLVMGIVLAAVLPSIGRLNRRFFISFFSIMIASTFAAIVDEVSLKDPDLVWLEVTAIFFEWLCYSIMMPLHTAYLLLCSGEDWRRSPVFRSVVALWLVFFALLIVSQFTDKFYYVTPDNLYIRGPLHPLLMLPLAIAPTIDLVALIRRRDKLSRKYYLAFLIYLIPIAIVGYIHAFVYVIGLVFLSLDIFTLVMFILILSDQIDRHTQQQHEIAQQKASIMVLQMRPHFIYNTMTSIYYLCEQDPKLAQQVTLDFTTYLRNNFNAIVSEDIIPFSHELEHAKAYLAVEQAQYEEDLLVDYDTPHVAFSVPPLTLQPIVENAVKHGMDPDSVPLHIWIRTRETSFGSVIVVEDDGVGFVTESGSKSPGALANIEQRLDMMCHGTIRVTPRVGGGTMVSVTIPTKRGRDTS